MVRVFKSFDLLADCWLGEEKFSGGSGKASGERYLLKRSKLVKFH
jgi:hypothetical protein